MPEFILSIPAAPASACTGAGGPARAAGRWKIPAEVRVLIRQWHRITQAGALPASKRN
jgi:hypothetical protein